ncbi:unnamed protein product, partial [Natator depressus]
AQLPQTQHLPAPRWGVAPGGAVTVWCECGCQGARVLLYKAGDPEARQGKDPPEDVAQFSIHNVSQRDAGSCSCRYSIKSDLSVWSEPSNAMELVVAAPHPAGYSEGLSPNGTLRARLCPELWIQQRGHPAGERGWSHCGVPQPGGAEAAGDSGQRKGGFLPPGRLQNRGPFPGG